MRLLPHVAHVAFVALTSLAACHDHVEIDDPCGEPTYGGKASDEAWLTILDAYDLATTDADAATLTAPALDAVLTGDPAALTWTSPLSEASFVFPPAAHASPGFTDRAAAALASLFSSRAHAHLPPVTGDIHYVELAISGEACGVRALTTDLAWTPTAAEWERLRGKGPITLTLTSAYLNNNRVTEGPFRTTSRFEVQ
jgi:hypothetical protein